MSTDNEGMITRPERRPVFLVSWQWTWAIWYAVRSDGLVEPPCAKASRNPRWSSFELKSGRGEEGVYIDF
jgi:hypothetical protein